MIDGKEMVDWEEIDRLEGKLKEYINNPAVVQLVPAIVAILRQALHMIEHLAIQLQTADLRLQHMKLQKQCDNDWCDGWVSTEEKLPECAEGTEVWNVLFQLKGTGTMFTGCYGRKGRWRDSYFTARGYSPETFDCKDVAAWRWLPEPWKEKERSMDGYRNSDE